jgi:phage tail-like protein
MATAEEQAGTSDSFAVNGRFKVTLDDQSGGGEAWFHEAHGLEMTMDTLEYRQGGEQAPRKLAGPPKYQNIVLARGITTSTKFFDWVKKCANNAASGDIQRAGGTIALVDQAGADIIAWTFERGFPCRYAGPKMSSADGGLALETIEIAHEGLQIV